MRRRPSSPARGRGASARDALFYNVGINTFFKYIYMPRIVCNPSKASIALKITTKKNKKI